MPRRGAISLDNITRIAQEALGNRITALTEQGLSEVEEAIHFALGLSF
jgi:mRNA-degrading endonuclease toxin of MazEF toxin-antitoxin module